MSRYIDKEKALQKIRDHISPAKEWLIEADNDYTKARADATIGAFVEIGLTIRDMPTADVEPVRHGSWIKNERKTDYGLIDEYIECSECGEEFDLVLVLSVLGYSEKNREDLFLYCPHCSAKMDEEHPTN